ncbi:Uncharacterized protein BP5553_07233 [Venustampulla echinocandica]|uniref:Peptidase A1 domain-containing protein n=1 Tax=Venustampulla echinocandica TaxID=2656787 RepID=A0A370TIY3_9HELO|nr:Uncharacterized protein BP5553_07233 [Venustampulla echinocandica]RDL35302.1 Uncharacterized protein BP5553_07233 [Venustampulla echinocandica]
MFSFLILSLAALTTALPTTDVLPRAASKPYQLRGVQAPIFHLYLQSLPSNQSEPVMGPEATSEYLYAVPFNIPPSNHTLYDIGTTIQSTNTSMYLNIGTSSASYKPLFFDKTSSTTAWALEGDTIITSQGSSYGRP